MLIDPKGPAGETSFGNAGSISVGNVMPQSTPGIVVKALRMLANPLAPLKLDWAVSPSYARRLLQFLSQGRREHVLPIIDALHAINTALEAQGFGPQLLCSVVTFEDATGRPLGLVYLYKQGTFYPFAPKPGTGQQRDNLLEMQIRDLVKNDLPIEPDLQRWMAVWGAPGL